MAERPTGKCLGCGKVLPLTELTRYDSQAGYEEGGYYCRDCLLVVEESDDSQDWLDELELDVDED